MDDAGTSALHQRGSVAPLRCRRCISTPGGVDPPPADTAALAESPGGADIPNAAAASTFRGRVDAPPETSGDMLLSGCLLLGAHMKRMMLGEDPNHG